MLRIPASGGRPEPFERIVFGGISYGRRILSQTLGSANPGGRPKGIVDKRHRMQVALMDDARVARQVEQVLHGIAAGAVPADIGKQIIDAIGTPSAVRASDELDARLAALEAKDVGL